MSEVVINSNGFLVVDGVKVCKVVNGNLEFKDRDRRRSQQRGSDTVTVSPQAIVGAISPPPPPPSIKNVDS